MLTVRLLTADGFHFDMSIPEGSIITDLQLFVPEGMIISIPFYHHGQRIHSQCNLPTEEIYSDIRHADHQVVIDVIGEDNDGETTEMPMRETPKL